MNILLWSERLALLALILAFAGIIVTRFGKLKIGLAVFALGCLLCLPAVLGIGWGWALSATPVKPIFTALLLVLCLIPAIMTVKFLATRHQYPRIHDITTDTEDPPVFQAAPNHRKENHNPLDIKPESISLQRKSYSDLKTLSVSLSRAAAFERAREVGRQMGWVFYWDDPEGGTLEGVATTRLMGFKDDIIVRIRTEGANTRIDLRSVSRRGRGDVGANAKRIRKFQRLFQQKSAS